MQIDGLVPFKSSIDQAIASLYFLRISISFFSLSSVKSVAIITGLIFQLLRRHILGFWVIPLELTPHNFFLTPVPSLHYCLIFLQCFHSNLILFLLIQPWHPDVKYQNPQYTINSSYFHSLNLESYNHQSVHN